MARGTLRLFVGAYPTPDVAERLARLTEAMELPPHRPVPPEQIHLTVQFIGDRSVRELDETIESVRRSGAGLPAFTLRPARLLALPARGPKRLVAVETDAPPALAEAKRRLVTRLSRDPRRDRRPFLPHLTLLRFRAPARGLDFDTAIPDDDGLHLHITRLALMLSTLHPDGARHREVAAVEFGPEETHHGDTEDTEST